MTTNSTASRLLRVLAVAAAMAIAAWLVVSAQRRANPPEPAPAPAPAAAGESRDAPAPAGALAEGQQPVAARRTRKTVIQAHLESCALVVPSVTTASKPRAVLPPTSQSLAPTPPLARRDQ